MSSNEKYEKEIQHIRKRAKWGCFAWFVMLVLVPVIWFIGRFAYEMYFKEETLLISNSPNNRKYLFTIKITNMEVPNE